jgi:hypothetical protein
MSEKITADAVETRQLRLVDAAGQVRALLKVGDEGTPSLKLVDSHGDVRLAVSIDEAGRAAVETMRDGKVSATLQTDARGGRVCLYDAAGNVRIKAEVADQDGPRIEFYNAAGLRESVLPAPTGPRLGR